MVYAILNDVVPSSSCVTPSPKNNGAGFASRVPASPIGNELSSGSRSSGSQCVSDDIDDDWTDTTAVTVSVHGRRGSPRVNLNAAFFSNDHQQIDDPDFLMQISPGGDGQIPPLMGIASLI